MFPRLGRILCLSAAAALAVCAEPQRGGAGRAVHAGDPKAGAKAGAHPPPHPGARGNRVPNGAVHQNMVDHLLSLPPEQQQQFMRNNPRFRNLPPEQQERIQKRLEQFNTLPQKRREALRERFELFRQLPPEQQDRARTLYRQWMQYPPDRRQHLMREFRQLRDASPEERQQRLGSDDFRNRFSDREQETLRGLADLLPQQQ